jgi:steroid delta-isomerase-like uncharacterized protein
MANDDVRSVVLGWTETLNQHDPDKATAFIAADCVFVNIGSGRRFVGRDAIREDFADLLDLWSELHIEVTHYFDNGQDWAAEWSMTGVHTGGAPGLPATGAAFRIAGTGIGQVRHRELVRIHLYWNMAEFLTQVGIASPAVR